MSRVLPILLALILLSSSAAACAEAVVWTLSKRESKNVEMTGGIELHAKVEALLKGCRKA